MKKNELRVFMQKCRKNKNFNKMYEKNIQNDFTILIFVVKCK